MLHTLTRLKSKLRFARARAISWVPDKADAVNLLIDPIFDFRRTKLEILVRSIVKRTRVDVSVENRIRVLRVGAARDGDTIEQVAPTILLTELEVVHWTTQHRLS